MRRGICPKCGQANIRCARNCSYWHGASTTGEMRVRVTPQPLSTEVSSLVDTYVCVSCGYFEQYLMSAEAIHAIAANWTYCPPQPTT
ncbi:MAG: hypothetical protein JST64_05030 [Actinobacteria bacterium]|nr:hypothetical protein [Actinomycetota bacterium]